MTTRVLKVPKLGTRGASPPLPVALHGMAFKHRSNVTSLYTITHLKCPLPHNTVLYYRNSIHICRREKHTLHSPLMWRWVFWSINSHVPNYTVACPVRPLPWNALLLEPRTSRSERRTPFSKHPVPLLNHDHILSHAIFVKQRPSQKVFLESLAWILHT
jgi:hypothetical protein